MTEFSYTSIYIQLGIQDKDKMKEFFVAALIVSCTLLYCSSAETIQQAKQRRENFFREQENRYHIEIKKQQEKSVTALRHSAEKTSFKTSNPNDIQAMKAFYEATDGPKWTNNTGWLKGDPCGTPFWYGLYCFDGRILQMNIVDNGLSGSIPAELAKASALQVIRLYGNLLDGEIAPEIFTMQSLQIFDVSGNTLTGTLPSEISMANLTDLIVYQNQLSGELPSTFNTPKLVRIEMSSNMFTGTLPPSLSKSPDLEEIVVSYNSLSGSLPDSFGSLTKMQRLWIFANNFDEPTIPDSWQSMTALQQFQADGLYGKMPYWLGEWTELTIFIVINGYLKGEFPASLCQSNKLSNLRIFNNSLTGQIPRCICTYSSLQDIEVSDNQFTGPIPDCIGDITNLQSLYFSRNNFTGELPRSVGQLSQLTVFDVSSNMMVGAIPNTINRLKDEIAGFEVCYNKFSTIEDGAEDFFNRIKDYSCAFYSNPWSCPLSPSIPKECGAVCSKCNTGNQHIQCSSCLQDQSCGWCSQGPNCLEGDASGPDSMYRCLSADWTTGNSSSACP